MSGSLQPVADVAERIERGETLILAAEAKLLDQLPPGNWIGGTVPCLPALDGAAPGPGLVQVTPLPGDVGDVCVHVYDATTVRDVYDDLAGKGFGIVIIPAASPTHLAFALHAPGYRGFAVRPLVGWVSGVPLDDLAAPSPWVYSGPTGCRLDDGAVVMHVTLPPGQVAEVGVVNIFEQGSGPAISFPHDGFDAVTALVDGVETGFAQYVRRENLDTRLPLVADYYGQMVNVSFRAVDPDAPLVNFYSPVFAGLTYRHARPVGNYAQELLAQLPSCWPRDVLFSCNCILNHFYSDAAGRQAQGSVGPLTFGEVGYQLLNQTLVYLRRSTVGG